MTTVLAVRSAHPLRRVPWRALRVAADIIAPTAIFYVLIDVGVGLYGALLVSAAFSGVSGLVDYWRGARQGTAVFMLLMSLASFAIALVSGSDRFLLARESVLTALSGLWFLWSLGGDRPLTYRFTRPLLEGRFGTTRRWEEQWAADAGFRRIFNVLAVIWAGALLLDAMLRVVIAYTLPVHTVPALQTGLMLATTVLMQIVTNIYYLRAGFWRRLHMPLPVRTPTDS